jgi:hypothetical protein
MKTIVRCAEVLRSVAWCLLLAIILQEEEATHG